MVICLSHRLLCVRISGDTLFIGSAGRTDLDGSDPNQLLESLSMLSNLPEDLKTYPG